MSATEEQDEEARSKDAKEGEEGDEEHIDHVAHTEQEADRGDSGSTLCNDLAWLLRIVFAYHLCVFAAFLCMVMVSLTLHLLSVSVLSQGDLPLDSRLRVLAYTTVVLVSVYHNLLPLANALDALLCDALSLRGPQFPSLRAQLLALRGPVVAGAAPAWAALPLFAVFCFLDPSVASFLAAARAGGIHWPLLAELAVLGGLGCLAAVGRLGVPCSGPTEVAIAVLERSKAVVAVVLVVSLVAGAVAYDGGVYQSLARLTMFSVFLPAFHLLAYLLVPLVHAALGAWADVQALESAVVASALGTVGLSVLPFWVSVLLPDVFEGQLPNMLLLLSAVRCFIGWRMPPPPREHLRHSVSLQGLMKVLMLVLPVVTVLLSWALAQQHLGAIKRGVSGSIHRDAEGQVLEIGQFVMNSSFYVGLTRSRDEVPARGCQQGAGRSCDSHWRGEPYGVGTARGNSRYALCDAEWGGLRLLDFAILSQLAYFDWEQHQDFLKKALPLLFDGVTGVPRIVEGQGLTVGNSTRGGGAMAKFYQFDFEELRLSVVAIRGTDPLDALDILQDIRLWAEPALASIISKLLPTIVLWPDGILAEFIKWIHRVQGLFNSKQTLDYFGPLESAITLQLARKNRAKWRFFVTGHSLGGGLAGIVGAHLQIPAIAFSPPGLMWSRMKFVGHLTDAARRAERELDSRGAADGILRTPSSDREGQKHVRLRDLAEFSVSVLPTRDPVPLFDKHFGLVQHTICYRSNPILCHIPGAIVCDLLARCGDAGRQRFRGCSTEASVSTMRRLLGR